MNIGKILLFGAVGGTLAFLLRSSKGKQISKDVLDKTKDWMMQLQKAGKNSSLWTMLKKQHVVAN